MAFAQFVSGSTASAAAEEEEAEDTETKRSSYTEVNFAVPEAPEAKSLMAGSEKELADLGVISDAQKSLNEALKAHNTIRLLPTYRNIFRQYELFKQMHEKAAQAVASSDQCVVQYLGRVTTSRKKSGTERWRRRPIRRIMTAEPGFRDGGCRLSGCQCRQDRGT